MMHDETYERHSPDETIREAIKEELHNFFNKDKELRSDEYDNTERDFETGSINPYPFGQPIGVEIVNSRPMVTVPKGSVQFVGEKTIVKPANPVLIVGRNPRRRSVLLWNIGVNNIAFSNGSTCKFGGTGNYGAPELPANFAITLDTQAEIWAICDPASTNGEPLNIVQIVEDGHFS